MPRTVWVLSLLLLTAGCPAIRSSKKHAAKRGGKVSKKTWDEERTLPKEPLPTPWPPAKGKTYPDITLPTPDGKLVRLSDHKGKVIIVEPIGMNCPGCQAFAGAHTIGAFRGVTPQPKLPSFEEIAKKRGLNVDDPNLLYVHLLLYDMNAAGAPSLADGRAWRKHFKVDQRKNWIVLVGDPRYINSASYNLIPGFQVIDQEFVLRMDATGHRPQDNLWLLFDQARELLAK